MNLVQMHVLLVSFHCEAAYPMALSFIDGVRYVVNWFQIYPSRCLCSMWIVLKDAQLRFQERPFRCRCVSSELSVSYRTYRYTV